MKQLVLSLIGVLCLSFTAISQNTVSGTITDEQGQPIPGVNILEKNTNNGFASDFDGNYTMIVADNVTLVFSYLGYKTQEIPVNNRSVINVTMAVDNAQLEEVVVIGYGAVKRDKIATSISTVKGEAIAQQVASNPAEALQGRAAGVQVLSSGGSPGASPQIIIRGITTFNGTQAPLIVIDNILQPDGTSLNAVNAQDIENIQILKDAAASAIYGSRASNGVVLITTKRGKSGKAIVNVDLNYGVQNWDKIQAADAQEYIEIINTRRANDGTVQLYNPSDFGTGTDWWDEVVVDYAPVTNANVRASGGSDNVKYSGSLSFFDQQSNYDKGWYQRVTGRFNVDFKISDKISVRQDLSPRVERWENTPGLLFNSLRIDPLTPVFIPQSEREGRNEFSIYGLSQNLVPNPVAAIARQFNENDFFGFFSNTQFDYKITPSLTLTSQVGLNYSSFTFQSFNPEYFIGPNRQREINNISKGVNQSFDFVLNNTITWDKTLLDKHYFNVLVGFLYDSENFSNLNGFRDGVPSNTNENLRELNAANGETVRTGGNRGTTNILSGVFRTIYSYDDRYFFNGSVRVDQSSKFPRKGRTGIFSSVSFAWDVDSEQFFNSETINNLRLKVGVGEIGNEGVNINSQFFSVGNDNFVLGGQAVVSNFLSRFGNPDLRWETLRDKNFGVELGFFNNALTLSAEYYERISENLLFSVELPNFTGVPGVVAQNVGSFESKGVDIALGYNKQWDDFKLGVNFNISTNESRATELAPGNDVLLGQRRPTLGNRFVKITELGQTVGLFQGYQTAGIFQNQTELNSHTSEDGTIIQQNAQIGDLRFVDQNNDGVLDDEDLVTIGNPFPDFYGGLGINMNYKKFDLSMQWYGTYGNDIYNGNTEYNRAGTQNLNVLAGTINEVWSPTNTGARFPRLTELDRNGNYQNPSDLFIEDGSYLRLRNIQLGYNFGIKGIQKCRLYVAGQNLLTFTDYSGFDPEVASGGLINGYGVDFARNPVSKTYILGLNLTL
ncbi:SusC/RagA family TonB-linked outer membrane protein [Hyunsoonleella pacifica]|uniref:TonB-dependent receptor n=1 Tax=Hyunsoonleella pacifica TaxID=1080224 RepID=A0A4Q9FTI7_9FLAO|nr:TonB-dependent receptor [Hyunsoonleella pacifica]TBN18659.1 TonB-dependent receptor [Hyunsoonleella pacifica]GGD03623.1 SusC/RagA family TonB-linked outer membrane protein [Hyunsoonleella pacifica]